MKDIKELALQVAEEINMKYADLNGDGLPGFCEELCTRFLAAYLKEQSAPSSEEVREMLARLNAVGNTSLEYAAADMIERLAARVPDGCVVVGYLDGRGRFFYADDPHMEIDHTGMREVFAAGEVK